MDNGSKPVIPSIVTEDLSSIPVIRIDSHEEKPSDPSLLSPGIIESGGRPLDAAASEDGVGDIPSPSLSTQSSVHFKTSMTLRDNKPGDGTTSLSLLSPQGNSRSHSRRPSNATMTSAEEGTVPDHPPGLPHPHPTGTPDKATDAGPTADPPSSPTPTHVGFVGDNEERIDKRERVRKRVEGNTEETPEEGEGDDGDERMELMELVQDVHIDPTPFAFKPYHLASLVDPKNFRALDAIGGTWGLMAGLGVDPNDGLGIGGKTSGTGEAPVVVITSLTDARGDAVEKIPLEPGAYRGTIEDRRRVYGSNVLPVRKNKPLLELMRLALKDKVLVNCSRLMRIKPTSEFSPFQILLAIAAVISLALGLFEDFGPGRGPGKPSANWIEGVAIIVAIVIVVCDSQLSHKLCALIPISKVMVGSLNDWQKERQFRILDNKREERNVKVIRFGIERVIDVKELLVGDIALLEPGEIIPCDGIFISGHNVKCDESGATGESDAIKKVAYDECIALREHAGSDGSDAHDFDIANARVDCFLVSGSKVVDGYGKYVVIAVGEKSFSGRLMMCSLFGNPLLIS